MIKFCGVSQFCSFLADPGLRRAGFGHRTAAEKAARRSCAEGAARERQVTYEGRTRVVFHVEVLVLNLERGGAYQLARRDVFVVVSGVVLAHHRCCLTTVTPVEQIRPRSYRSYRLRRSYRSYR